MLITYFYFSETVYFCKKKTSMQNIEFTQKLKSTVTNFKKEGKIVGFVPTMGFLHTGHLSLIQACKKECDICIVSIYVNPSQFNESSDFDNYPKDLNRDLDLLQNHGCDVVFIPSEKEITKFPLSLSYRVDDLDSIMEGARRPGHFKGVIEVVYRLFLAVQPNLAFFGEKDFQQFQVISRMVYHNQMDVKVVSVPTEREYDGLAMSSRNIRLSSSQRKVASTFYYLLKELASGGKNSITNSILKTKKQLEEKGFEVEYLQFYEFPQGGKRLFGAVKLGSVRLIDNVALN